MSYEFQNTLFETRKDLCEAIAGEWLSAGGMNDRATIEEIIAESEPNELVAECVEAWGLDPDWMEERGIDKMWLFRGFVSVMQDPASAFGW